MQEELRVAVADSLQHHAYANAVFLAERLCAENSSEENVSILANAYVLNSQHAAALALTKARNSSQNRYLFALAAFKLNKLQEAEQALLIGEDRQIPNGAFGWHLLGEICRKANRPTQAVQYFRQCIVNNPLIWTAYEHLCQLGQDIDANQFFGNDTLHRLIELRKDHGTMNTTSNSTNDSSGFRQNVSQNTSFTPLAPNPPAAFDIHSTPGNSTAASPPADATPTEGRRMQQSMTMIMNSSTNNAHQQHFVTPSPPHVLDTPPQISVGFKAPRDRHKVWKCARFGFCLFVRFGCSKLWESFGLGGEEREMRGDLSENW